MMKKIKGTIITKNPSYNHINFLEFQTFNPVNDNYHIYLKM